MRKIIFLFILLVIISCKREDYNNVIQSNISPQLITRKLIRPEQLKGKTTQELRILRNEIFARKGYVFKDSVLNDHFSKKEWYKPNKDAEMILTDLEKQNVELLKNLETE